MPQAIEPSFATLNADAVNDVDVQAFVHAFGGVYLLWAIGRETYHTIGDRHETLDIELR
jgi:hypothetical protein